MLDMFIFETTEMIDQLQQLMIDSEKAQEIDSATINEIFRIMHTIKGASGMMMFDNIAHLSHSVEDMFFFIRENKPEHIDYSSLVDILFECGDLIREETERINDGLEANTDFSEALEKVEGFLNQLKEENGLVKKDEDKDLKKPIIETKFYITNELSNKQIFFYTAIIFFEEDCQMENIRSFTVLHKLKEIAEVLYNEPEDILSDEGAADLIRQNGFKICFQTDKVLEKIDEFLQDTIYLDHFELRTFDSQEKLMESLSPEEENPNTKEPNQDLSQTITKEQPILIKEPDREQLNEQVKQQIKEKLIADVPVDKGTQKSSFISVDVHKLDKLMDLVGELVISESMVTNSPALKGIVQDDFHKAIRQHRKRITELQDAVMSIRMVSLAPTLNKMNRIVRDMCKKLDKKAELEIIGENTEVDKSIIEHLGDPLMHIVRNSMDHGIETLSERQEKKKRETGKITIEAKNSGGDVFIIIKDDGKGLDKNKILQKAINNGVIVGDGSNLTDKEIYATIFSPGLSTKEKVTEFSGRGVGMDVVVKEIEKVRGTVSVDSIYGEGTTITIKIPLTVAILDGMTIKVGNSIFTVPVTSIKQSIIVKKDEVFRDLDNKEMITIRGECYSILRIHEFYKLQTDITEIEDGIVIMAEEDGKTICLFADELLGEQQVVIKALPEYINKIKGTSGCTLLGNGNISLILDIAQLVNM